EHCLDERQLARDDFAGGAVDGDDIALADHDLASAGHVDAEQPLRVIDLEITASGDAALAHAARDHGGVRGHAPTSREDCTGALHTLDVLGARLIAHQHD